MVKKIKLEPNKLYNLNNLDLYSESEEDRWKALLIDMIKDESYLGAYLMIQEKLRKQAKEDSLIQDKRTEGIN